MMNDKERSDITQRLKKIEGQVRGVQKMVADEKYCIDLITQTRAVAAALRKVEEIILNQHLRTCVAGSMKSGDSREQDEKIGEIMELFSRFGR